MFTVNGETSGGVKDAAMTPVRTSYICMVDVGVPRASNVLSG